MIVSKFFKLAVTVVVFGALTSCSDSEGTTVSPAGSGDSAANNDAQGNDGNVNDGMLQEDGGNKDVVQDDTTPEQDASQPDGAEPDVVESDGAEPDGAGPDAPFDSQPADTTIDVPFDIELPDGAAECVECVMSKCQEHYDKCMADAQCKAVVNCVLEEAKCPSNPNPIGCAAECAEKNGVGSTSPAFMTAWAAYTCIQTHCKGKCNF